MTYTLILLAGGKGTNFGWWSRILNSYLKCNNISP